MQVVRSELVVLVAVGAVDLLQTQTQTEKTEPRTEVVEVVGQLEHRRFLRKAEATAVRA